MKKLIAFSLSLALICLAQATVVAQQSEDEEQVYSIEFPGGTIGEYVGLVRAIHDNSQPLNVVVTESAENFRLPSVNAQTTLEGVLGVIEGCSTEANSVNVDTDNSGEVYIIRVEYQEPIRFDVTSVKALLNDIPKESLLSAVEIGLEMQGPGANVSLKLHEETGLLFVKGPESSVELVQTIIDQLEGGVSREAGNAGGSDGRGGSGGRSGR